MITPVLEPTVVSASVRWIDLAAVLAMGGLWLLVFLMFVGIWRILRSKARGDAGWGDSPGL
jgi:hypothetical protein